MHIIRHYLLLNTKAFNFCKQNYDPTKISTVLMNKKLLGIIYYQTIWIDVDKVYREKARRELHKNAMSYIEQF